MKSITFSSFGSNEIAYHLWENHWKCIDIEPLNNVVMVAIIIGKYEILRYDAAPRACSAIPGICKNNAIQTGIHFTLMFIKCLPPMIFNWSPSDSDVPGWILISTEWREKSKSSINNEIQWKMGFHSSIGLSILP